MGQLGFIFACFLLLMIVPVALFLVTFIYRWSCELCGLPKPTVLVAALKSTDAGRGAPILFYLLPYTLMTFGAFALLAGLGLWVGGMYVVLRAGLPFKSTWARVAFFAFGVFGFSWTWFHMFLVIIDLAGLLHVGLLAGLPGAVGVFVGALAYEWLARVIPS